MIAGGICVSERLMIAAGNVLSLRHCAGAVIVATSEGVLYLESRFAWYLLRDCLADRLGRIEIGAQRGSAPLVYSIEQAEFSRRGPGQVRLQPDHNPLRPGLWLMEGEVWADYHPADSLQIVAAKAEHTLIVGFSGATYELRFVDSSVRDRAIKLITDASPPDGPPWHFTVHDAAAFLDWIPSSFPRVHCLAIKELPHRPGAWGSLNLVYDRREEPSAAAFASRCRPALGFERAAIPER